jgi:hypothetical protein
LPGCSTVPQTKGPPSRINWSEEGRQVSVVFVVNYIKASKDWVWVTVSPRSPDSKERYEEQSALFHKEESKWVLKATLDRSGEDVLDNYKEIRNKYPTAPNGIFDLQ